GGNCMSSARARLTVSFPLRSWRGILSAHCETRLCRTKGRMAMTRFTSRCMFLLSGVFALFGSASSAQFAEIASPPDFSGGWINEGTFNGGGLVAIPGQPYFKQDARFPHIANNSGRQPTYWIADLASNANVKQWAKDVMKKDNDEVIKG